MANLEGAGGRVKETQAFYIRFEEGLTQEAFDHLVASFEKKDNPLRLWGKPISRGPGKVHVYAVDRDFWEPVDIELTRTYAYALLSKGAPKQIIQRLKENVRRPYKPPDDGVRLTAHDHSA